MEFTIFRFASAAALGSADGKREYASQDMSAIKTPSSTAITFETFWFISPSQFRE
jgi:hypothetical protein